jgi:signal transduction histidine kinase
VGTAVAVAVCAIVATVLEQLDVQAGTGVAARVVGALQVIASALFLGAGVLRIARFRVAGCQRSLRMGVALVVFGAFALPLTSLAGIIASGEDSGSMLRPATAMATIGVSQLVVFRAVTGTDPRRPHSIRLLVTACGSALLLFLALVGVHALWPTFLHAEALAPTALRGATLAAVWLYVGLEAALRSEGRAWVGKAAPLLGCMGVAELLRVVAVYHPGGWELAAAALLALLGGLVAHRALMDLDETVRATQRRDEDIADHHAWHEEMAHDARNALAGLRAALTTLEKYDGVLDTATCGRLRSAALGEINHLEHLIIRSDQADPVDFDVAEVVTHVVDSQRANGADIALDVHPLRVHGRPGDLATALQNLVVNARDHGGNRITVRTSRIGDQMELLVSDRGPGLAEGQVATLFQRGARGPESRGSGLGLHVSRTLMRQQGGDLVLREHVDGATFAITLPLAVPVAWTEPRRTAVPVRSFALAAAEAS